MQAETPANTTNEIPHQAGIAPEASEEQKMDDNPFGIYPEVIDSEAEDGEKRQGQDDDEVVDEAPCSINPEVVIEPAAPPPAPPARQCSEDLPIVSDLPARPSSNPPRPISEGEWFENYYQTWPYGDPDFDDPEVDDDWDGRYDSEPDDDTMLTAEEYAAELRQLGY